MARVLYRLWFGQRAFELNACSASQVRSLRRPLELLIGDEALVRRSGFRAVIDIGEWWRELTDLPFVFAVWQSTTKKPLPPVWRQKIIEAAEIAQARMRMDPSYYLQDVQPVDASGRPLDLASYWKVIQYRLTPQHFMGLALFLALGRLVMPEQASDQAVVNIMRVMSLPNGTATA
jgi:predicted solute-binding protein